MIHDKRVGVGPHEHKDEGKTMVRLADRTQRISSSPTMKVTATVDRLPREGVGVIDFGAVEPSFRTHAEDGFAVKAQPILDAVTPRTRGIIVNSPCNPTGALIAETDLAALAEVAARQSIWIILDLCYEKLIYDDVPHNLPRVLAD